MKDLICITCSPQKDDAGKIVWRSALYNVTHQILVWFDEQTYTTVAGAVRKATREWYLREEESCDGS